MDGRDEIRLHVYTLVCYLLLDRLNILTSAVEGHRQYDGQGCIKLVDFHLDALAKVGAYGTADESASRMAGKVSEIAGLLTDSGCAAAAVFDEIARQVTLLSPTWAFTTAVDQLHAQGRGLAERFYRHHPDAPSAPAFSVRCEFAPDRTNPMQTFMVVSEIRVAFHKAEMFWDFYLRPFQFLHEYTAHAMANDNGENIVFHDGWMLFAADRFLQVELRRLYEKHPTAAERMRVPELRWLPSAHRISSYLDGQALAALEPWNEFDKGDWRTGYEAARWAWWALTPGRDEAFFALSCRLATRVLADNDDWKNRFALDVAEMLRCGDKRDQDMQADLLAAGDLDAAYEAAREWKARRKKLF